MWVMLFVTSTARTAIIVFFSFSVDCACFYISDHVRSFYHLDISFLFSNFVQHCGNLKKCCWGRTRRICTITKNNAKKLKNLENLKPNLWKYHYPNSLIKEGFRKALSIPPKDLRTPKKPTNENILPFITTFNPNTLIFIALLNKC